MNLREHRQKVAIGSKYAGIPFDRPALRQMPRHWTLDLSEPARKPLSPDAWVAIACVLAVLVGVAQIWLGAV